MVQTDRNQGIYYPTIDGYCSWYEFVCILFKQTGTSINVDSIIVKGYPMQARILKKFYGKKCLVKIFSKN